MRKLVIILVVIAALPFGTPRGADPKAEKIAAELIDLMNAEGNLAQLREEYGQLMDSRMKSLDVPPEMQNKLAAHQEKLMKILSDSLSWESLQPHYVEVYTTLFTLDELQGLLDFYRTPVGRTYARKLPILTTRLLDLSRARIQEITPIMQKMTAEFAEGIKKEAADQEPRAPGPGN